MATFRSMETPAVTREVDVLVVGGGPAGVGAAIAAARQGAKTLVVEQFNCLGGVATAGGHGHISIFSEWGGPQRIVGGIAHELADRVVSEGFGTRSPHGIWFEVEGLKLILDKMAKENGLGVLYYTFFCEAVVEDGVITGAVMQNKTGRQVVRAKRVVDCTGEAAGTAAALSLQDGVSPRRLDVAKLQAILRQKGGILSEEDIERANA